MKPHLLFLTAFALTVALPQAFAQSLQEAPVGKFSAPESIPAPLTEGEADVLILKAEAEKREPETWKNARRVRFQVLDRTETTLDGRKLIWNRVAPPERAELKSAAWEPEQKPANVNELAEQERLSQLAQAQFNYSATVYDRAVTCLRWQYDGQTYVAWSNVDFNYLRGVTQLEHGDTLYHIFMGIGNERTPERAFRESTMAMSRATRSPVPLLPAFTPGRAEYVLFLDEGSGNPDPQAFTAMDALHAYYEQNARRLQTEHQRAEALKAARKRYDEAHPKPKKDAVIHFWPEKNSAYENGDPASGESDQATKGGNQ